MKRGKQQLLTAPSVIFVHFCYVFCNFCPFLIYILNLLCLHFNLDFYFYILAILTLMCVYVKVYVTFQIELMLL